MGRLETAGTTILKTLGKLAILATFAMLIVVASSYDASAQISIASQTVGVTTGRQTSLTFSHSVPNVSDRILFLSIALGKQSGTLSGVTAFYDPDGAGPIAEQPLDKVVGVFYEGNNDNALRGISMFYRSSPTVTPAGFTGTIRIANVNPQGLHMAGFAYTLTGTNGTAPFNSICTDTDPAGTPNASCTIGTAANNGFIIDTIVMVASATMSGETPSGKGGLSSVGGPTPRERTSLDSGGQDLRATSGAFANTSSSSSAVTGYAHNANNAFLFVAVGFTPSNITEADVSYFTASRFTETMRGQATDRGTLLSWRTSTERDNIGFNLYREDPGATRVRVNSDLIAGSSLMTRAALVAGYGYAWWDPNGSDLSQYWLESIDANGKSEFSGPYLPTVKSGAAPGAASSQTVGKMNSDALQQSIVTGAPAGYRTPGMARAKGGGGGSAPSTALETQWQLAARPGVKLSVADRGWYRVTQADLAAAGVDTASVDPRTFQLFADGVEQAIQVSGSSDGHFDAGDTIEFFGTGVDVSTTATRVYWLTSGSAIGKRIKIAPGKPANGFAATFPYAVEHKERSIYIGNVNNGERENFFGRLIITSLDTDINLDDVANAAGSARIDVGVQGFYQTPHNIEVSVNGQVLGLINGEGETYASASFAVPHVLLHEGNNVVTLTRMGSTLHLLDYIRITYQRSSVASQNELLLQTTSRSPLSIGGFTTPDVRVVDVTDPASVQEYTARVAGDGTSFTAAVSSTIGRTLYAFGADVVRSPVAIEMNRPSAWNLASNRADVVMISHRDFIAELAPLKALRESQGYTVAVVDVDDIYDEFGYGYHTPIAIKAFLSRSASWQKAPEYVLLVGDATSDPRNYLGAGDVDFVPTRLVDTLDYQAAYDDWLADRDGDDVPELAVGRLPVRTVAEAHTVVGKILAYEAAPAGPISSLFVADAENGDDFEANSQELEAIVPSSVTLQQIYRGQVGTTVARQQLLDALNEGRSLVNYAGHGSVTVWASNILTDADAPSLTNSNKLSVFTVSDCLNGYFHASVGDCLGEALVKAPGGGAIAVWASSGITPSTNQHSVMLEFYIYLFSSPNATVGEAARHAKTAATHDVRQSWVLLGDPLTHLK